MTKNACLYVQIFKKKTNDFEKNSTSNNVNQIKFRKRFETNQKIEKANENVRKKKKNQSQNNNFFRRVDDKSAHFFLIFVN